MLVKENQNGHRWTDVGISEAAVSQRWHKTFRSAPTRGNGRHDKMTRCQDAAVRVPFLNILAGLDHGHLFSSLQGTSKSVGILHFAMGTSQQTCDYLRQCTTWANAPI